MGGRWVFWGMREIGYCDVLWEWKWVRNLVGIYLVKPQYDREDKPTFLFPSPGIINSSQILLLLTGQFKTGLRSSSFLNFYIQSLTFVYFFVFMYRYSALDFLSFLQYDIYRIGRKTSVPLGATFL